MASSDYDSSSSASPPPSPRTAAPRRASAAPKQRPRTAKHYPVADEEEGAELPAWMATFNASNYERRRVEVTADGENKHATVYVPYDPTLPTLHQLASAFAIMCCVEKPVVSVAITTLLGERTNSGLKKVTLPKKIL